jgi:hypothetical protein
MLKSLEPKKKALATFRIRPIPRYKNEAQQNGTIITQIDYNNLKSSVKLIFLEAIINIKLLNNYPPDLINFFSSQL